MGGPVQRTGGDAHTITATASSGVQVIATRTVTGTVVPEPPPAVDLVTPDDGAAAFVDQPLRVTGTATGHGALVVRVDDEPRTTIPVPSTDALGNGVAPAGYTYTTRLG